jgi:hypothetical protein
MQRIIALLPLVAGCSATLVTPPPITSPTAPVNELTKPGIVAYTVDGWASLERKRREDAYRQMRARCGGPYRIDAEGPRVVGGTVTAAETLDVSEKWYIQFSCVR